MGTMVTWHVGVTRTQKHNSTTGQVMQTMYTSWFTLIIKYMYMYSEVQHNRLTMCVHTCVRMYMY